MSLRLGTASGNIRVIGLPLMALPTCFSSIATDECGDTDAG